MINNIQMYGGFKVKIPIVVLFEHFKSENDAYMYLVHDMTNYYFELFNTDNMLCGGAMSISRGEITRYHDCYKCYISVIHYDCYKILEDSYE